MKSILAVWQKQLKSVWQSVFVRNVAIVTSGMVGAQVIGFAFAPLITRLYGPEAFGLMGVFLAATGMLAPIAALTYPVAIVLPQDDRDALGIVRLSLYLSFGIAGLMAVTLWAIGDKFAELLSLQLPAPIILLFPVFMLFAAWRDVATQWLIRKKLFSVTTHVAIMQALIVNISKVGIGFFHPIGTSLILIATFGTALQAAMLTLGIRSKFSNPINKFKTDDIGQPSLWLLACRYYDFPLYRAPKVFVDAASASLPILMLSALFNPESAGYYTLAITVLGMPATLIANSVEKVLYPKITEASHRCEPLMNLIMKAATGLALVAIIPFCIIIIFGPSLFSLIFGDSWHTAGEYAQWVTVWLYLSFVIRAFFCVVPILSLQRENLILDIVTFIVSGIALSIGLFFENDVLAVALYSFTGAIARIILAVLVIFSALNFDRKVTQCC